jgi:HlyD family secretion protein
VYILTTPPAQPAIDQAHANMLLAENKLNNTRKQVERVQRQVKKAPLFLRGRLEKSIQNMEVQIIRDERAYEKAVKKYEDLLAPPDTIDLARAQADLKAAQARRAEAQRQADRLEDGFTQAEIALAEARLADAQREWERLKDGPDPADIAEAKARVAAAEASLNRSRLTAPFEGVITQVSNKPGDVVSPGSPAFRLDDLSRLLVDLQVSEVDINQIQAGQAVILTLDAIPGKDYHGIVIETAPAGAETAGVVYFQVTVEFTDADSLVRPGMTAAAEIITGDE